MGFGGVSCAGIRLPEYPREDEPELVGALPTGIGIAEHAGDFGGGEADVAGDHRVELLRDEGHGGDAGVLRALGRFPPVRAAHAVV